MQIPFRQLDIELPNGHRRAIRYPADRLSDVTDELAKLTNDGELNFVQCIELIELATQGYVHDLEQGNIPASEGDSK